MLNSEKSKVLRARHFRSLAGRTPGRTGPNRSMRLREYWSRRNRQTIGVFRRRYFMHMREMRLLRLERANQRHILRSLEELELQYIDNTVFFWVSQLVQVLQLRHSVSETGLQLLIGYLRQGVSNLRQLHQTNRMRVNLMPSPYRETTRLLRPFSRVCLIHKVKIGLMCPRRASPRSSVLRF